MKYSILEFNQREVLKLQKTEIENGKEVNIAIDLIDLAILNVVADLANRKSITKVVLDDKQYSWISYKILLEDLPILRIEKKQLTRRLQKLQSFDLVEVRVERLHGAGTFTYLRIGAGYEKIKYAQTDSQESLMGVVKNDEGGSQECLPKDKYTIQDNNIINKETNILSYISKESKGLDPSSEVATSHSKSAVVPLEERKQAFIDKVYSFSNVYDRRLLDNFIDYWTECGGRKMRFEKEKTYELALRLKTWKRNEDERQARYQTKYKSSVLASNESQSNGYPKAVDASEYFKNMK